MRRILAFIAGLTMVLSGMFIAPAQALTCGGIVHQTQRTSWAGPDEVYTQIAFKYCTGTGGNQIIRLVSALVGYNWSVGSGTACTGFPNLEKVTFDTRFWDNNTSWYDYGPITIPCDQDGMNAFLVNLSNAPNYRVDQGARWENYIKVHQNGTWDYDVTHGGNYF